VEPTLMLKPAPETLACEIVTSELPLLVNVAGLEMLFPTWTLP